MIQFSKNIPRLERRRIINKAPFNIGAKGKITANKLLEEIKRLEKEYLKKPLQKYFLWSSISTSRFTVLKKITINTCTITFHPNINKIVSKEFEKIKGQATNSVYGELPRDYIHFKVNVSAKSYTEAADKAIDAIDLVRGIWNLFYNRRQSFRMSSGFRKPVNKFVLGPLHTLHLPNGKLATESWWYQTNYRGPLSIHNTNKDINYLYKFQNNVRRLLKKSKYKDVLEEAILRYGRALDLADWESAFLKLWGVLELLTNTGENESHKVTIKRASFIFHDREYTRQVLNHLRDYRNRAVHTDTSSDDIETFIYQLKRYVEVLLEFHLLNKFGFKNITEVSQFLDLSTDQSILKSRLRLLKSANKLLSK
jgi:hypothetical protein